MAERTLAQSYVNDVVVNAKLDRPDEVRRLAERVVEDEQFGARAQELLAGLR